MRKERTLIHADRADGLAALDLGIAAEELVIGLAAAGHGLSGLWEATLGLVGEAAALAILLAGAGLAGVAEAVDAHERTATAARVELAAGGRATLRFGRGVAAGELHALRAAGEGEEEGYDDNAQIFTPSPPLGGEGWGEGGGPLAGRLGRLCDGVPPSP